MTKPSPGLWLGHLRVQVHDAQLERELSTILDARPDGGSPQQRLEVLELRDAPEVPARGSDFYHGDAHFFVDGDRVIVRAGPARFVVDGHRIGAFCAHLPHGDPSLWYAVVWPSVLLVAARAHASFHVHAALLDWPPFGGVLVVGESGAGKSTTALALIHAGARWLGDDVALIRRVDDGSGAVSASALARPFHVAPTTATMFHLDIPEADQRPALSGKASVDLQHLGIGQRSWDAVRVSHILCPEVVPDSQTACVPSAPVDTYLHVVRATAWATLPGLTRHRDHNLAIEDLTRTTRAWRVLLGADMLQDARVLAAHIARALAT